MVSELKSKRMRSSGIAAFLWKRPPQNVKCFHYITNLEAE